MTCKKCGSKLFEMTNCGFIIYYCEKCGKQGDEC